MRYPEGPIFQHPYDNSVCTYRGHSVHKTLIRCYFSPIHNTGQRYIYSGSENGAVYVYNLDGSIETILDINGIDRKLGRMASFYQGSFFGGLETPVIRDVSWHPTMPVIACAAWTSRGRMGGLIARFSWKS